MSDNLEIAWVDPFDDATFDAWHEVYATSQCFGREETAAVWTLEELRVQMQHQGTGRWAGAYLGRVAGTAVASGFVMMSLVDNLDRTSLWVDVLPERRRRGHGSAMLDHVLDVAREKGRSIIATEASWSYDAHPEGAGEPGVEFLRAHGFDLGLVEIQRTLRLPVDDALLAELAARAATRHEGYTLRSWVGPVPDELLESWAALSSSLMTEAPVGELDLEPESADVALVREAEDVIAKQGRTKYNTAALDADGVVVAYTDLATAVHDPGKAYQWGTLVRGDHRGHRLGMAVKVANLQQLQALDTTTRCVITWNAEVNSHMIGVNEEIGFRRTERAGAFQRKLV